MWPRSMPMCTKAVTCKPSAAGRRRASYRAITPPLFQAVVAPAALRRRQPYRLRQLKVGHAAVLLQQGQDAHVDAVEFEHMQQVLTYAANRTTFPLFQPRASEYESPFPAHMRTI